MRYAIPFACATVVSGLLGFAAPIAPAQAASETVLVLPFEVQAGPDGQWLGKAVQQDLLTDLTQGTHARVLAPAGASAAVDSDTALKAAHNLGATIVIFGQAQSAGKDVRLTGQVLQVADSKPLGAVKATGPSDQLFHLEDALAGQVFVALPRPLLTQQAVLGLQQAAAAVNQTAISTQQAQAALPQPPFVPADRSAPPQEYAPPQGYTAAPVVDGTDTSAPPPYYAEQQAPIYSYPDYQPAPVYSYPYPVPAYSYGYPGCDLFPAFEFGSGLELGLGFGFFGGDFGGDFHHEGFGHDGRGGFDHGAYNHGYTNYHGNGNQNGALAGGHTSMANGMAGRTGSLNQTGVARSNVAGPNSGQFSRARAQSPGVNQFRSASNAFRSTPSMNGFRASAPRGGMARSSPFSGSFHSSASAGRFGGSSFHGSGGGFGASAFRGGGGGSAFHSSGGGGGFHGGGGGGGFHGGGGGGSHGGGGHR